MYLSHFCFRGENWGYIILQLSACNRSLGTLFELLIETIVPRVLLLRHLDLQIENGLWG